MTTKQIPTQSGTHYTAADFGPWELMHEHVINIAGNQIPGKVFLKETLNFTGMEVSLGKIPAGLGVPWSHKHKENEETYIFVKGQGQFLIDGEVLNVQEGTVVRVAPDGVRAWRNNSTEDLHYIVIQAKAHSLGGYTITDGEIVEPRATWPE